jgi:phosphoribosylamine--glycine ligase
MNLLTTMKNDFVDVCYRMIEGTLKDLRFSREASVVTCAVPLAYGTSVPSVKTGDGIYLTRAYEREEKYNDKLRVFPMDLRMEDGTTRLGSSRSVAVVGIGASVEEARGISLEGVLVLDGPVRYRTDIAIKSDIQRSIDHLRSLRAAHRTPE